MTDPIADMLTRLRNAVIAKHSRVDIPTSKLKVEIARILEDEGYIQGFKLVDEKSPEAAKAAVARQMIRILLKYGPNGEKVISGLERISRPGRRVYFRRNEVPHVLGGLGTSILTTSRGVMTGRAAARAGVGGEVLCNVW
jgi:small subunit ribosomal protein S8